MNVSRLLAKKELRGGADAGPIMGSKIQAPSFAADDGKESAAD